MKTAKLIILNLCLLALFASCKDTYEWSTYEPIEIEYSSINFDQSPDNKFDYYGELSSSPATVSFIPLVRLKCWGCVTSVRLDDVYLVPIDIEAPVTDSVPVGSKTIYEGEWGSLGYYKESEEDNYSIVVDFTENTSGSPRTLSIHLSDAYAMANVNLTQSAGQE